MLGSTQKVNQALLVELHQPRLDQSPTSSSAPRLRAASHASRVYSSFPPAFIAPTKLAPTQGSRALSQLKAATLSSSGSSCVFSLAIVSEEVVDPGCRVEKGVPPLMMLMCRLRPRREVYRFSRCSRVCKELARRSVKPGSILPPPTSRIFEMNTLRRSMGNCGFKISFVRNACAERTDLQ